MLVSHLVCLRWLDLPFGGWKSNAEHDYASSRMLPKSEPACTRRHQPSQDAFQYSVARIAPLRLTLGICRYLITRLPQVNCKLSWHHRRWCLDHWADRKINWESLVWTTNCTGFQRRFFQTTFLRLDDVAGPASKLPKGQCLWAGALGVDLLANLAMKITCS